VRIWSSETAKETAPVAREETIVSAVDAALGFVAGQRWMPRQMAVALLEAVRDTARSGDTAGYLEALIDSALEQCDSDPILAGALTDALLDIRNATSRAHELTRSSVR
jgi:hypothetical protein